MPTNRPIAPHLAALTFCALASLPLLAQSSAPWTAKDWHEWTEKECNKVLTSSPWATTLFLDRNDSSPIRFERVSYTIQLVSALPIRHALARQEQMNNQSAPVNPGDPQTTRPGKGDELTEDYDDRIVVRVVIDLVDLPHPSPDVVSRYSPKSLWIAFRPGRGLTPLDFLGNRPKLNSHSQWVLDSTFQRLRGGQPLFNPKDKKIRIEFLSPTGTPPILAVEFGLRKMMYAGKLEY
jgi:hypothetical protein